jgi:hypothetical protein
MSDPTGRYFHFFPFAIIPKAAESCLRLWRPRNRNWMNVCSSERGFGNARPRAPTSLACEPKAFPTGNKRQ